MPKENGLTKRQQEVLKLIRKGSRVTVKKLLELSAERFEKSAPDVEDGELVPNDAVAGYHLRRLELAGKLELVEGGGRGLARTWKRVA